MKFGVQTIFLKLPNTLMVSILYFLIKSHYNIDGGCVMPPTDEFIYNKPIQPWKTCLISSNYRYESTNYLNYFCQATARRQDDDEAINDSLIYEHAEQNQIQKLQSLQQINNHIPANDEPRKQQIADSTQTAQVLVGTSKPPQRRADDQKRQAIACYNCRQRRLKCDGENPCSPCVRRGVADTCAFAQQVRRRGPGRKKLAQLASVGDVDAAKTLGIEPGHWIRDPELFPPSPKRTGND